ncbi:hypothetical protein Hanom_Chr12g01105871 [Helianthus anomalus]
MHLYNHGFIPPRSNVDTNQTTNPSHPVSPVPTRHTPYGFGFVDYDQPQTRFMNLLNQPLSGDLNLYGWNPNHNMGGIGSPQGFSSARAFDSSLREPDFVPDTQPVVDEAQQNKTKRNHNKKTETRTKKMCNHWMIERSTH